MARLIIREDLVTIFLCWPDIKVGVIDLDLAGCLAGLVVFEHVAMGTVEGRTCARSG